MNIIVTYYIILIDIFLAIYLLTKVYTNTVSAFYMKIIVTSVFIHSTFTVVYYTYPYKTILHNINILSLFLNQRQRRWTYIHNQRIIKPLPFLIKFFIAKITR